MNCRRRATKKYEEVCEGYWRKQTQILQYLHGHTDSINEIAITMNGKYFPIRIFERRKMLNLLIHHQ